MIMKHLITLSILLFLSSGNLSADERSLREKQEAAFSVLNQQTAKDTRTAKKSEIVALDTRKGITVMGYAGGEGFAVIANNDAYNAVVGYTQGHYSQDIPEGLAWWLDCADEVLSKAPAQSEEDVANVEQIIRDNGYAPSVAQLMKSEWGQDEPYNSKCPPSSASVLPPAGCGATAMAQVMNYHRWPEKGTGSHTYNWTRDDGQVLALSANFGQTAYRWDLMPTNCAIFRYTDEEADAVSTLLYHCGVAANMNYRTAESSSYAYDVCSAFHTYFGYSDHAQLRHRSYYSATDWMTMLLGELNAGRPVLYGGTNTENGKYSGHIFVVDGYEANGLVHVNWGWDSQFNGMFDISLMNPYPGCSYNVMQYMIIGIAKPGTENIPYYSELSLSIALFLDYSGGKLVYDSWIGFEIYNESDRPFTGKLAVVIEGEDYFREITSMTLDNLAVNSFSEGLILNHPLPSDLPDGSFLVYLAAQDAATGQWQRIRHSLNYTNEYRLTKQGEAVTLTAGIGQIDLNGTITDIPAITTTDNSSGTVQVYNVHGQLVLTAPAATFSPALIPGRGIFLIKQGDRTEKLLKK